MKILIVSSLYGVAGGGSGVMAHHLAHGLSDAGHSVAVVTMGATRHYSVEVEQGIKVYRFRPMNLYPFKEKDTHPVWQKVIWQIIDIYNFHSAAVLRQIFLRERPDIIHINKMRGFSGAVWAVACELFPGRVIQTCHDYESMSPDGVMRGLIGRMALNKRWPVRGYQLIRAGLSSKISTVSAPSKFALGRIVESGLFPSADSVVISNTHGWSSDELKIIQARSCSPFPGEVRFLFIGRLEPEKGIQELCQAFIQLFASYPSIHLDIAGSGSLDIYLSGKYGSHTGIHFYGMVDGKLKEDILCKATAVIIPSLVDEVFGLVTVEAFAFGKPVIASNVGGLPELVLPGQTGWLFDPGNIQSLKENMENIIKTNPLLLLRMGKNCMEYSTKFAKDKIIKKYEETFSKLIR